MLGRANNVFEILIRNPREINCFGELGSVERIMLKQVFEK
jgi:hypothetical protein